MTEMLTVVAIIAVLIAVAAPAVVAASRNLKMRELDDTAREVFLAAQNTLSARKADGTLAAPKGDQVGGQDDWYWLFDDETGFLLPDGAVEPAVAENHIAVWYNADSAMVLEVYYGEKNGSFASPPCEWDENGVRSGDYSNASGKADTRAEKRIGYYDGTDLDRGGVEQLLPPLLEIVNGNELTVKVTVPRAGEYWTNAVSLTVTVEELDDSGVPTGKAAEFTGLTYSAGDGTYELVLDSLTEEGQRFKSVCPDIIPGANIRVTAKLSAPEKEGTKYLSASAWEETNSLFEKRTGDTVSVAWARHLQNLDVAFSGFTSESAVEAGQTGSINWLETGAAYHPISNDRIASYNGNGLEIRGLNGGLFDRTTDGMRLDGIRIVNPRINGTGAVGALANTASGTVIDDCQVYAITIDPEKTGDQAEDFTRLEKEFTVTGGTAGGFIGSAEGCTITNSFAALSKVSGSTAGGFIGSINGGRIENCYATAENLTGTTQSAMFAGSMSGGTVTGCYAAGNIASAGGTVSGFANGSGSFASSYCAVSYNDGEGKPTEATPVCGFASGSITSPCAYLTVKTPAGTDGAAGKSYDELKTWGSGWQTLSAAETHPYRKELDGKAYPFPGLAMPHYGSWPVQTVKDIKLYDAASGGNEIHMIMVPRGGEATVWAEADGGMGVNVKAPQKSDILRKQDITSVPGQEGERTNVTVKARQNKTGVTYIDMEAGGYQLRVVVVVYEVEVTLQGKNQTTGATATGKADQTGTGAIGQLSLRTNGKVGEFTASLTKIVPTEQSILEELSAMQTGLGAQAALSATAADFARWDELKAGDPAVTANGSPGEGSNILAPVDGNYYPTADSTGKLTVTGEASGTATVSARWAMDEKAAAKCDVKMEGARALIQAVSAKGKDHSDLGAKDDYPYYLGIRAEPGETVSLSFTPKLFGGNGTGQSYTWTISGGALETPVTEEKSVFGDGSDVWTCDLTGNTGWNTYTVKLVYANDRGERSVDYMTFSIYCAAKKQNTTYGAVKVGKSDGQGFLNGDMASVEQINGSTVSGYEHTAELELQSWVEGANNTRVKWSYSTDGGTTWSAVTGQLGSIPIYETLENGETRIRATVQWMNDDLEYNGKATGGAVKIVGLDANEYDRDFTCKLRAEAAEATVNGDAIAAARTVDVTVKRKLQITPESLTTRRWGGNAANQKGTFNANREDALFDYMWSVDGGEQAKGGAKRTVNGKDGAQAVELYYGPHMAKAVFTNIDLLNISDWGNSITTSINCDVEKDENQYFLVEKQTARTLVYSWGAQIFKSYKIQADPGDIRQGTTKYASIVKTGNGEEGASGWQEYTVTGDEFTRDAYKPMEWTMQNKNWPYSTISATHYLSVVGMDLKWPGKSDSDTSLSLLHPGDTTSLTADWSFPSDLMVADTEPVVTWTVDHVDLIAFGTDTASETDTAFGESVAIVAKKYSATDYIATITATCTIQCVNGREYTYKKYISVKVPPATGMTVTVEPCTASDIAGLNGAFGDGLAADSLLAAVDGSGTPVLIRDSAFGCDTLYLKVRAGLGGGFADLNDYFCNLYIDRSFVEVDTALSSDGTTMYVRLKAKEATADVCRLELGTVIGSAPKHNQAIDLYAYPEIALTWNGEDVTNGSIPVYQDETDLSITLGAALTPVLYSADDTAKEMPLDQIQWYLQGPDGYDAQSYLKMSAEEGSEVTLSIRDVGRMPDFRVVLHARSARSAVSDAGYALVFLPATRS